MKNVMVAKITIKLRIIVSGFRAFMHIQNKK